MIKYYVAYSINKTNLFQYKLINSKINKILESLPQTTIKTKWIITPFCCYRNRENVTLLKWSNFHFCFVFQITDNTGGKNTQQRPTLTAFDPQPPEIVWSAFKYHAQSSSFPLVTFLQSFMKICCYSIYITTQREQPLHYDIKTFFCLCLSSFWSPFFIIIWRFNSNNDDHHHFVSFHLLDYIFFFFLTAHNYYGSLHSYYHDRRKNTRVV